MRKKTYTVALTITVLMGLNISSCKNENDSIIEQDSQLTLQKEISSEEFERLTFNSSQDLLSAIQKGEEAGIEEIANTRSSTFKSLLSKCNSSTRSNETETYYEALGYDTIVPNKAFAALLSPLGEVQTNDTIYRINHNGTYFFSKE